MILRPRQSQLVDRSIASLDQHGNTLAVAPTGCHAPGTLILMYDGSTKMVEDIVVGDQLMGMDSLPRQVLDLHRGRDDMYEVRPMKGESFVVNAGHMLTLVRTNEGKGCRGGEIVDIPLSQYLNATATIRHLHKLFRVAVDFPIREIPVLDPYFLGVLIGDGGLKHSIGITTPDSEIAETIYWQADQLNLSVRVEQLPNNLANTYYLVGTRGVSNVLIDVLRDLGLYGLGAKDKFLPEAYKFGNRATRLAIMAGLLDTDGHLSRGRLFEFCSRSKRLAEDVAFVARSLGFMANLRCKKVADTDYWRIFISGDCHEIPVRIGRKQAPLRRQIKDVRRTGFTVHAKGMGDYYGFTVDADHRYLLADFTVTHNSGKTIMLSAVAGNVLANLDLKACILAHRDELTRQNHSKFKRVNPGISTSVFDADEKSWSGQATFAMVQTLSRNTHLKAMPTIDLLVIDEAHHAASPTYRKIVDQVLDTNADAQIFGVTATPNRGDGKGLREVFSNVADQITLGELVRTGYLVPPRTFVIDVGTQGELSRVSRTSMDFDMNEVASIMNKAPITEAVIRHWRDKAHDRKTIVFCSTVAHADSVCEAFNRAGIASVLIHGELSDADRQQRLADFESGVAQVVVNVAVLTEGYDYTPTACIILLRPSSYKSTLIQMIGRGLRTVDPEEFPGVVKTDCIVLDFGTATLTHGSLEQEVNLDGSSHQEPKLCPVCEAEVPRSIMECPLCGYIWEREEGEELPPSSEREPLADFVMSEIDLLKRSNFRWCDLFGCDDALMATGFNAWGGIFFLNGRWYAIGGRKEMKPRLLAVGERTVCMAQADDWLNEHESQDSAHKSRHWLNQPPTEKQLRHLPPQVRTDFGLTRYQASALLSFLFNKASIQQLVMAANSSYREAA